MIDQLRALNNTAYITLVFGFADLEGVNRLKIETQLKLPLSELFDRQKNADRAKRTLKGDFNKAVALYFHDFLSPTGFSAERLSQKLDASGPVFERHLGQDKVKYLRHLISTQRIIQEKPKGLLGVA